MCGICGVLALDGAGRPDESELRAMNATLRHRGPDSEGHLLDGPAALAMRRLAIIDIEGGDQPLANEDGTVHVVLNGEIYNHAELRDALARRGHRFATRSDTEVIAHLYEEHGDGFAGYLRGMFAVALWDSVRRRMVLARDRFGIKPLFWSDRSGELTFASELRALAARRSFPRAIDDDALTAYLAFNSVPGPLSIYAAARKLPPGHLLVAEDGRVQLERFARPAPTDARATSRAVAAEQLREVLRDSVRAHLVSDVPVGVLLSGGVDSGTLAALAAGEVDRLRTFSIGFGEPSFDELEGARAVASRYGTDHHELVVEPDAAELLPQVAAAFDEPLGDSSALPTWLVSRMAAGTVKVVLSGEGADELFGGYHTYVADLLGERAGWAGPPLRAVTRMLPSSDRRVSLDFKLRRFARGLGHPPLERHHRFKEILGAEARSELLGDRVGADPLASWRARFAETAGAPLLARLQDVDAGPYLVDDLLVKTDRASMAHSLETRTPFLDEHVARFAHSLPTRLKVRGFEKKRVLRDAVRPLLPPTVVDGPKRGFSIPAAAWLRGPMQPFAREVLSPANVEGLVDSRAVTALLDRHCARRDDLSRPLWGLMCLVLWRDAQR